MSLRSYSLVWEGSEATGTELLVLLAIAEHHNRERGYAWPSVETIAGYARIKSLRTVQKHVRSLEERGELKVVVGGGRRNPSRYYLNFQKLRARAEARNKAQENPADFAGFNNSGQEVVTVEVFKETPQSEGAESDKPRNLSAETPQSGDPELRGKVEDPDQTESVRNPAPPGGAAHTHDLDGEEKLPGQWRRMEERLRDVWPDAGPLSEREREALAGPDAGRLWAWSAEQWDAWWVWTREAGDRVRGRTLWPRNRHEALVPGRTAETPVAEMEAQVSDWWHRRGKRWWKREEQRRETHGGPVPQRRMQTPPEDYFEWLLAAGIDAGEAVAAWNDGRHAKAYNEWVIKTVAANEG